MAKIDFGASTGSTDAGNYIRHHISGLLDAFEEFNDRDDYFKDLDKFHIVFLVSGKNQDYESEGPENLRKVRGKNVLVIYFAIPEDKWMNSNGPEYVASSVRECLALLSQRASKMFGSESLDDFLKESNSCLKSFEFNE